MRVLWVRRLVVMACCLLKVFWLVIIKRYGYVSDSVCWVDFLLWLREVVEELGLMYIKFGQIILLGEGLFLVELVSEFKRCWD